MLSMMRWLRPALNTSTCRRRRIGCGTRFKRRSIEETNMYAFEYQRAKSVADAAAALSKSSGKALAGGQSLVGAMKLRLANPGTVVDLSGISELNGIKKDGEAIVIGALTTHADVASSPAGQQAETPLAPPAEGTADSPGAHPGTSGGAP